MPNTTPDADGTDWRAFTRADFREGLAPQLPGVERVARTMIPAVPDAMGTEALFGDPVRPRPARAARRATLPPTPTDALF